MGPWLDQPCAGQVEKRHGLLGWPRDAGVSLGSGTGVFDSVLFCRDVRSLGITMMGHQKKILNSIQAMRSQLLNTNGPRRHL